MSKRRTMATGHCTPAHASRGVTLIELMVGLVIGLIATLIVAQVLEVAENQKRTATSGNDAQLNGALALYSLQRELQMAGYGLVVNRSMLGCETRGSYMGSAAGTLPLTPISITDGADNSPDTITIITSDKAGASLPTRIVADHPKDGTEFVVQSTVGMRTGDVLIAVPATINASNWCSVLNVTGTSIVAGTRRVAHVADGTGPWNTNPAASVFPPTGYLVNSYLVNAGQIVQRRYSVSNNHVLQETVGGTQTGGVLGIPVDLYPEIVNLQALYGKDTNNDGVVDAYNSTTPATTAEWAQVLVIRVALVARSSQFEKEEVSAAQPLWDVGDDANVEVQGATPCGTSRCIELKVNNLADWRRYRYKVYDAVVPLRNVLWG